MKKKNGYKRFELIVPLAPIIPDICCGQGAEGLPNKPKKGLLGLGDRLAAKAAAIAKTAGNALQAVRATRSPSPSFLSSVLNHRCLDPRDKTIRILRPKKWALQLLQ